MKRVLLLSTLLSLCITKTATAHSLADLCQNLEAHSSPLTIPPQVKQILWVKPTHDFQAELILCQRSNINHWFSVLSTPIQAVIGKQGIAPLGRKKEGDHKTPAGFYPLGEAFGSQPIALRMDFRYLTADDKFIDDASSKDYNTWVNGDTDAHHFETMLVPQYRLGAVISYNQNPVIKGAGSAIFFHIWASANQGTEGCVATDQSSVKTIMRWFDKKQHPSVLVLSHR
jgi:L,D-peptidoglycan transpeptidase YkuD (ErfK/YbiS/YcfS/YnhG family)